MSQLRQTLENENALDEFDRIVFESIVEKVIVGGYDAEGNVVGEMCSPADADTCGDSGVTSS